MQKNFKIENREANISINKNIYEKNTLLHATYVKLEKFYFLVDEDEKNYIISMRKKEGNIEEKDVLEFFDELIESAAYLEQLKKTSSIRQTILEKALIPYSIEKDKD